MSGSAASHRETTLVSSIAVAVAVLLPPVALAQWMRPAGDPLVGQVAMGFWLLKALLAAHAVAAIAMVRHLQAHDVDSPATSAGPVGLLALLAFGMALRLPGIGDGLWFDEIQTLVEYVRQPWGILLTTFDSTNQHLLFSISARAIREVAGESAMALRLPAMIFGVLSLWAAVEFGRRWMPARESWWAAIILAVSYHHIWFSQNARGYTGLLLGTLLSSTLLLDMLRSGAPSRRQVWGYAFVIALTLLTHVTALVVVAGHGVAWLAALSSRPRGSARWAPFAAMVLGCTVAVMLYAPVIPQLVGALSSSGTSSAGIQWQDPMWFLREAVTGLSRGVPAAAFALPVAGLVLVVGAASAWRARRTAVTLMVVPMVMMAALLIMTGHNLWPRFFFFAAAFIVQLAVHGGFAVLGRVVPRHASRIGDAGLAVVSVASLALLPRAWAPKQDFPAAERYMNNNARPGDSIAVTDMLRLPMVEWLGQPWPVVDSRDALQRLEGPHTTWVVYTFPIRLSVTAPELYGYMQSDYEIAHVVPATIGGGEIVIMKKDAVSVLSRANRPPRTSTQ